MIKNYYLKYNISNFEKPGFGGHQSVLCWWKRQKGIPDSSIAFHNTLN